MECPDNIPNAREKSQRPTDMESLAGQEEQDGHNQNNGTEWEPGKQEFAVMITIATVSLMVALDATILVPVLPVCIPFHNLTT
jgi:hypothetical protein